jgi:uncharacterized protein
LGSAARTLGLPKDDTCHFILYVADQSVSTDFYSAALGRRPDLSVPGMTEFRLGQGAVLGLMPYAGARRLLGASVPDPTTAAGVPRAEVYLVVDEPGVYLENAARAGERLLSPLAERDWGHRAGYVTDPDGHVLAFAALLIDSPHQSPRVGIRVSWWRSNS